MIMQETPLHEDVDSRIIGDLVPMGSSCSPSQSICGGSSLQASSTVLGGEIQRNAFSAGVCQVHANAQCDGSLALVFYMH